MRLYIHTLGDFDISIEGRSLMENSSRSYKLIRLFEYFITFKGRKLLPETIIENLWQDSESDNPKNVLRTQIFRLRQTMKRIIPESLDMSKYYNISFNNGYYTFELGELAVLDTIEFESLIGQGESKRLESIDESIELYCKAIKLYKGQYLSENSYEAWLVPKRNYYNMLYLKSLLRLVEMLNEKEDYGRIIELCEEAIIVEPYEEALHICLIEAMLKIGQIRNAMSHYEYIAFLLNKEFGIQSSPGLKKIYSKIQSCYDEKNESDIRNINAKLEESSPNGAMLCDSEYFKFLFNINKRKGLRDGIVDYMSLITINCDKRTMKSEDDLKKYVKTMSGVLEKSLRKGDVYSYWNDKQILVMLHGAKEDSLKKVESRIRDNFNNSIMTDNCKIGIEFLPLNSNKYII
ncbi:MAG TPA: BTAD domain-containing putative transcriptional regulator [Bacillota bacterium]|nr:BTAD domain-containing putative transcriptional regulator [Bacillota bacterium]